MRVRTLLLLLVPLMTAAIRPALADLTPELVKRCKQATGLVRVVDEAEGTAFHIGDGIFLTNRHVIKESASGAKIEIVLNSGEKNQKLYSVRLVRADKYLDLALVKIEKIDSAELPPALELGDISDLVETMPVAVFGFPFGTELAVGKNEFPSISVNLGRITALRKAEGAIEAIQTDTPVSPGNSGGPLLDGKGQVIGVIQAHVDGEEVTFAISGDRVRKFLFGAGILLRVTPLQFSPGAQATLSVELIGPKKEGAPETAVTMRLSAYAQDQREYKMTADGKGLYTVRAPLIPAVDPDVLNADIEDEGDQWSILLKDQIVQIAGRSVRLSAIKVITQGIASSVELTNGQRLAGSVIGLSSAACIRNRTPGTVDLSHMPTVRISRLPDSSKVINYEISVQSATNIVTSQKGTISANGVRPEIPRRSPEEREERDPDRGATNIPSNIRVVRWDKNGHYYVAIQYERSLRWLECASIAKSMRYQGKRGHLATITSWAENEFIGRQFPHVRETGYFLGGYQDRNAPDYREPDGGWRWITGEKWDFTAWGPGQLDNHGGVEDYLHIMENGTWNDITDLNGSIHWGFIVEFEQFAVSPTKVGDRPKAC